MPSSLAFQVDKYDQQKWEEHTKLVEKDVPEPGQGEVLVQVYLRPGTCGLFRPDRLRSLVLQSLAAPQARLNELNRL